MRPPRTAPRAAATARGHGAHAAAARDRAARAPFRASAGARSRAVYRDVRGRRQGQAERGGPAARRAAAPAAPRLALARARGQGPGARGRRNRRRREPGAARPGGGAVGPRRAGARRPARPPTAHARCTDVCVRRGTRAGIGRLGTVAGARDSAMMMRWAAGSAPRKAGPTQPGCRRVQQQCVRRRVPPWRGVQSPPRAAQAQGGDGPLIKPKGPAT